MKAKIILGVLIIASILILLGTVTLIKPKTDLADASNLIITEVVSNNQSIISDYMGDYSDYIEIYNSGDTPINLEGYGLSDSGSLPLKWTFPLVVIEPDSYLLVYASEKNISTQLGQLHTNFTLNQYGDLVVLSDPSGKTIQQLPIPQAISNMAYCLSHEDPMIYVFYTTGTPASKNAGTIIADVKTYMNASDIDYSIEAGFYDHPIELALSIQKSDAVIYYTLDGNNPRTTDFLYNGPIHIENRNSDDPIYAMYDTFTYDTIYGNSKNLDSDDVYLGTVVKAQAYVDGVPFGPVMTKSYFVDELGSNRYTFPIVSLTVDPDIFFDEVDGIYTVGSYYESIAPFQVDGETDANYNQRGSEWERAVNIEYFNTEGVLQLSQGIGARTFGGWSRMYPKKSLKLFPDKAYDDQKVLDYPFFTGLTDVNGEPIDRFSNLVLRNGGNDWEYTMFRDIFMTELVDDVIDVQAAQPVVLFINGEYWGIYNLREIINDAYIKSHYGVDKSDVTMIVYSPTGYELYDGDEEDIADYESFISYLETHDLSNDTYYETAVNQIDLDNFLNFYIANIYFANTDWPGNNAKLWRKDIEGVDEDAPIGQDGKWRYVLYDTDFGFNLYPGMTSDGHNTLALATSKNGDEWPNPPWSTIILRSFLTNDHFKNAFINRMMDFLSTRFSPDEVNASIDYYVALFQPEIQENTERWLPPMTSDESSWANMNVKVLHTFADVLPKNLRLIMQSFFDLEIAANITIKKSGSDGYINVNNYVRVLEDTTTFEGRYYNQILITLEAVPLAGHTFVGWTGDIESTESMIQVGVTEGMTIIANFE
jgi:hypothetical protein